MSTPRVLVAVVTYDGKDYIFPKNYELVSNLTYPNYDFVIIDNSKGLNYVNKLRRRGVKNVVHLQRCSNSRATLAKCQNYARKKVIDKEYDYLMLIESDLLPPKDIIERLMFHRMPVVGSYYLIGTKGLKLPCMFVKDFKAESGLSGTRIVGLKEAAGKKYIDEDELKQFAEPMLHKIHGVGFGSTLIRRDIVERFPFWYDERFDDKHSDVYFYMDLENAYIPVYVDSSVKIEHFPTSWDDVEDR